MEIPGDIPVDVNILSDSDSDLEDYVNVAFRRPRILHERVDHMNHWDDLDFVHRFRLSKRTVHILANELEEEIHHHTER